MSKKGIENYQIEIDNDQNVTINMIDDMLEVSLVCDVSTTVNLTYIDYIKQSNHNIYYEEFIREKPIYFCKCCNRFLFKDQLVYFKIVNNATKSLDILPADNLCDKCRTKLAQNLVPNISAKGNFLSSGSIPSELKYLSQLEKKLFKKISIFMTIVVLPGGQYAEKGLILNLPNDIDSIISQLPQKMQMCHISL